MIHHYGGTILVSAALWCGLLLALILQGCGGRGGDSSTPDRGQGQEVSQNPNPTPPPPSNSNETTNCYFDEATGVNLGEVGETNSEVAALERIKEGINVSIQACNSTVTVNADGSVTTTTSTTTTTNPKPEID